MQLVLRKRPQLYLSSTYKGEKIKLREPESLLKQKLAYARNRGMHKKHSF